MCIASAGRQPGYADPRGVMRVAQPGIERHPVRDSYPADMLPGC